MTFGKINWQTLAGYTVSAADMELFQSYMMNLTKSYIKGSRTKGIIYGGRISTVSGMQLKVSAGLALMPDDQLVIFPETNFVINAANVANARYDRVELAYAAVNNTSVIDINSNPLVLDFLYTPNLTVLVGTPAVTPVAPTASNSNLSLGFVKVSVGQTSILAGDVTQTEGSSFISSAIHLGNQNAFVRFNQTTGVFEYSNDGARYSSLSSGGGGGGGGGANWVGMDGFSPQELIEYSEKALSFSRAQSQSSSLWIKVPSSYLSGSPISMKLSHYSPGAVSNFKFITVTTLIRKNQDAITSTTNQYSSTNAEVINSLALKHIETIYDLSDVHGVIGSVGVSPGDLILVSIQRVAPSGTEDDEDVRMIPSSTEILFS